MDLIEKKITFENNEEILNVLGKKDENLRRFREHFRVEIIPRGNLVYLKGVKEKVERIEVIINNLIQTYRNSGYVDSTDIDYFIHLSENWNNEEELKKISNSVITLGTTGKEIRPRTLGQKIYIESVRKNELVFCIGPAGTGKTYLAVAIAVEALYSGSISRIYLVRPAVEAGERLGFLPGDYVEKMAPYFKPLYDALFDMMDFQRFQSYREKGIIEIAPLAYMRGRTLNDSIVILDEAQNTTPKQMKMFLTRLGRGTRTIVTGDITQVDLPPGSISGLKAVQSVLKGIESIKFVYLNEKDIVRHTLVQKIINAYNLYEGGQ